MSVGTVSLENIQQTFADLVPVGSASSSSTSTTAFALTLAEAENDVSGLSAGSTQSLGETVASELGDDTSSSLLALGNSDTSSTSLSTLLAALEGGDGASVSEGASGADTSLAVTTNSTDALDEPATTTPTGSAAVSEASQYLGTPYVWGGSTPSTGFDCSGLVQYVYGQLGVSLPRTSQEQATVGTPVASLADAQPGDLVFFAGSDGTATSPGHVGIYIGNGQMIDAPYTGTDVQVQTIDPSSVVAIRDVVPTTANPTGTTTMGSVSVPAAYAATIEQAASANNIPASLLASVIQHESGFNPDAVSSAGAQGIAQFMPSTAAGIGVNPFDPTSAINGAAHLLGAYTQRFGSYADAVAAYNAGATAVARYGGIPPYPETEAYVPAVLNAAGLSDSNVVTS